MSNTGGSAGGGSSDDDFDPSAWLSKQFDGPLFPPEPEEAPAPVAPEDVPTQATPTFPAASPLFPPAAPLFPPAPTPVPTSFPPVPTGFPPVPTGFPPAAPGFPPAAPQFPPTEPQFPPAATGFPFTQPSYPTAPSVQPETTAFPAYGQDLAVRPGGEIPPAAPAPTPPTAPWLAAPLDASLEGPTEVFQAELVGQTMPIDEGVEVNPLDALFGATQFHDFSDEPLIAPLVRQRVDVVDDGARAAIPRNQKVLMWVAGSLVAVLALVALFLVGTRISRDTHTPAAAITPTATPTPTATAAAVGPVAPGTYHWDQLLGGECLRPFTSAWQDNYVVVDCSAPHPAQLVYRGTFNDALDVGYPGVDELQKRINLLCTTPAIINYAAAGTVADIQISASFAADDDQWLNGDRSYFCFATRSTGADLTASIAVPQVAATPTPAASPSQ